MTTSARSDRTEVGNYFVANYPPFSAWTRVESLLPRFFKPEHRAVRYS